jgi:hypothetical protein
MELYHFGIIVQRGRPAKGLLDSLHVKSLRRESGLLLWRDCQDDFQVVRSLSGYRL